MRIAFLFYFSGKFAVFPFAREEGIAGVQGGGSDEVLLFHDPERVFPGGGDGMLRLRAVFSRTSAGTGDEVVEAIRVDDKNGIFPGNLQLSVIGFRLSKFLPGDKCNC